MWRRIYYGGFRSKEMSGKWDMGWSRNNMQRYLEFCLVGFCIVLLLKRVSVGPATEAFLELVLFFRLITIFLVCVLIS